MSSSAHQVISKVINDHLFIVNEISAILQYLLNLMILHLLALITQPKPEIIQTNLQSLVILILLVIRLLKLLERLANLLQVIDLPRAPGNQAD